MWQFLELLRIGRLVAGEVEERRLLRKLRNACPPPTSKPNMDNGAADSSTDGWTTQMLTTTPVILVTDACTSLLARFAYMSWPTVEKNSCIMSAITLHGSACTNTSSKDCPMGSTFVCKWWMWQKGHKVLCMTVGPSANALVTMLA